MITTSLASDSALPAVGELFENVLRASLLGGCAILTVLVLRRLLKRSLSPAARCVLWLPVAALLASPRLPDLGWGTGHETLPLRVATKSQTPTKQNEIVVRTDSPVFLLPAGKEATDSVRPLRLFPIATWVWATGSALVMAFWLLNYLLLCVRISRSKQPVPEQLASLVTLCSKLIGLRKPPLLKVTDAVSTPALMGLFRPTIIVPPALDEALDANQMRMVMLHESGHVKRHDLIFHWFALVLLALHWFNPLCWLAAWLFRADREAACDAAVLNACEQDSRALYGHTLLKLQAGLSSGLRFRPLVGVLGSADMLRQRILEIARFGRSSRWVGVSAVVGMTVASLGLAVFAAEPAKPKAPAPASSGPTADKGLETRVYKLPPSFFKPSGVEATSDQIEPKSWLADQGVEFPEGSSAVYSKTTSQLVLRNTVKNLNVAEKLIDLQLVEHEKSRRQVYITTKLVVFDEKALGKAFAIEPGQNNLSLVTPKADPLSLIGALTDPQLQVIFRALSQQKSGSPIPNVNADPDVKVEAVLSLPSVTVRGGYKASVEVVREFQFPTEYKPGANGADAKPVAFDKRDVGFKMGVLPVISGEGTTVELSLSPEITTFMEMKDFGKGVRQPVFSSNSIATSVTINDGETIELAGEMPISSFLLDPKAKDITAPSAKRYPVLLFVTPRVIDPSGQPLNKPKGTSAAKALKAQPQNKPQPALAAAPVGIEVSVVHVELLSKPGEGPDLLRLGDVVDTKRAEPPKKDAAPASKEKNVPVVDLNNAAGLGVMAISGVFTGPQRDVVLKSLDQRRGTTLHLFEPENLPVADGKAEFALSGYKPGRKMVVKPTVGPDGNTVDVEITIPSAVSDKGDIRTAVTLWDGQAAVLSGVVSDDEKGTKTSWLFITTKIIREKKAESK